MKLNKMIWTGFLTLAAGVMTLCGGENLLRNPGFTSKDGSLPDHWYGYGKEAYTTENGAVRISAKTAVYAAYMGQTVEIEPGKGYYFSVDMKSDRLTHHAGIFYSILGENRKNLVSSRPLLRHYTGPQKDWVRIGFGADSATPQPSPVPFFPFLDWIHIVLITSILSL